MLLLFRASGDTEGTAGITFGVSGTVTATAVATLAFGVPAPSSAELNIHATAAITLGANGNRIPETVSSGTASLLLDGTARGGQASAGTVSTILNASGTVGSFLDGQGTANLALDLSAASYPVTSGTTAIGFEMSGLPEISGGIVDAGGTAQLTLNLNGAPVTGSFSTADLSLFAVGTGIAKSGVNPDATPIDRRPRTTLRSFLIGN